MDLLPRTHHEFGNKDYWEKFFRKRGKKAFEWYGEYTQLCSILSKYIKTADKILIVGCGNSELSADMYDVGYHDLLNIDISSTVIQQMTEKHSSSRPEMKFFCMDIFEMDFPDGSFSVVLDKGTLDAIFTDDSPEVILKVEKVLAEIGRVLRIGGRYVCISLAQDHIIGKVLRHFVNEGWMVRVCRMSDVDNANDGRKEFKLPVFVFVFTKFRKMINSVSILELSLFENRNERVESVENLISSVQEIQRYALIRQRLQKSSGLNEQISLELCSSDSALPRYTVFVVDGRGSPRKKFAVFIVPQGRETDWLFSCDEGRKELQRNAGFERLLVVLLNHEIDYHCLDDVKAELSSKVLELAPPDVQKQTPFLSLGDSINLRTVRDRGKSNFSGDYVVEDVDRDGDIFRRLIFTGNCNMVQSEIRLAQGDRKKRGGKKQQSTTVDHDHLSSNYYGTVISGLAFIENLQSVLDSGLEILLLGLGGGPLAMFLHKNISKAKVEAVEIDPAVIDVAKKWFNLQLNEHLAVHIADGLEFIAEINQLGHQKHVIILDIDNKDVSIGMSSPPESFVAHDVLSMLHASLKPSGVFILNMLCRSQQKRQEVLSTLKEVFAFVFGAKNREDLNETLFCIPKSRTSEANFVQKGSKTEELTASIRLLEDRINANSKRPFAAKLDNLNLL